MILLTAVQWLSAFFKQYSFVAWLHRYFLPDVRFQWFNDIQQVWPVPEGGSEVAHSCLWGAVLWLHRALRPHLFPTAGKTLIPNIPGILPPVHRFQDLHPAFTVGGKGASRWGRGRWTWQKEKTFTWESYVGATKDSFLRNKTTFKFQTKVFGDCLHYATGYRLLS